MELLLSRLFRRCYIYGFVPFNQRMLCFCNVLPVYNPLFSLVELAEFNLAKLKQQIGLVLETRLRFRKNNECL